MTVIEWLNLGSLVLGLAAWSLPIVGIARRRISGQDNPLIPTISMGFCATSLCLQVLFSSSKVAEGDWSGLSELSPILTGVCMLLVVVTLSLNTILLIMMRKPSPKKVR